MGHRLIHLAVRGGADDDLVDDCLSARRVADLARRPETRPDDLSDDSGKDRVVVSPRPTQHGWMAEW